jgi:hypothetical protein
MKNYPGGTPGNVDKEVALKLRILGFMQSTQ